MADVVGAAGSGFRLVPGLPVAASHRVGDGAAQQAAVVQEDSFVRKDVEGEELVVIRRQLFQIDGMW